MNAKQSNRLASYVATQAVFEAYPEIANQPGLPAKLAELSAKVGGIESLAQTQKQQTEGRTARRDELLKAMVDLALEVAGVVGVVAVEQQLTELAQEANVTRAAFGRLRRSHRPWLAGRVLVAAQSVVSELGTYGVTAATLETLRERIEAAREGLKQPRAAILEKRAAGAMLAALFAEVDALLGDQVDRLVAPWEATHVGFHAAYRSARAIIDRGGSRKSGEEGTPLPVLTPVVVATPTSEQAAA